jgi:hypothetical protein
MLHQQSSVIQQKWSRLQCQDIAAVLVSMQVTTKLVLEAVIWKSKHLQQQKTDHPRGSITGIS